MEEVFKRIINKNKGLEKEGEVASYIPALAKANPKDIGLVIIDKEKNIYKLGDYNIKFTLQSISKVLTLMLALIDNGEDKVFKRVGYEGTDEAFNSLYKLDLPYTKKPVNPMVNSGAIVTTSLIKDKEEGRFNRILNIVRQASNNPDINYSEEVYISETTTGEKNRALVYLMKSRSMLEENPEKVLDDYFKQCAIEVDTIDLANIAMFIANGCNGLDSFGEMSKERLSTILTSIMNNSGMYNFSGQYAAEVGIPSKSGVAGGIIGVVPSRLGIGVYSPALDKYGNSRIGYAIMKDLSKELNLSLF